MTVRDMLGLCQGLNPDSEMFVATMELATLIDDDRCVYRSITHVAEGINRPINGVIIDTGNEVVRR